MKSNTLKGYLLALIGALALALSFIFSKSALNTVHFVQFGLVWFAMGFIWLCGYIWISGDYRKILKLGTSGHIYTFLVGLFEALGTVFFYLALNKVDNPAIVSFLGNAGPVFVTIFGILLLKEKYSGLELFGVLLAIMGIFTISFRGGNLIKELFIDGTEWIILASLMFATGTLIGRKKIEKVSPSMLSMIRVLLLLIVFIILLFSLNLDLEIPGRAYVNMAIGSLLEALITMVAAYSALKYIQAVEMSILISTKSIWVLISALIFFGLFPEIHQVIGGILSLIGVFLLTSGKRIKRKRSA
ncbi:MAG: DMT family transporter [Bacteroidetes bacterium]|jgi:drug/metabolite transporter (DMT)-like permease|nr:DMT family transporter [Bacteroidota bacterium]MBT3751396.1 DMT family transporter [Bacteroidota bacterium]MBT4397903.1 DMT family transporter [Bacteroidota bacterium]MBT4411522.1 DMT family transporter [Bacteroidota bacterium]MBT5425907.1 DMT family transporter [Bacteroidota bacterium]